VETSFPLQRDIKELVFLEKRQKLMVRDRQGSLWAADVNRGSVDPVTSSRRRLSRIIDPDGEVLLSEDLGESFDLMRDLWTWFAPSGGMPLHHLFWKMGQLYSIGEVATRAAKKFQLYRYDKSSAEALPICDPIALPGKDEARVRVAETSHYPYAVLYKTEPHGRGEALSLRLMNVLTCELKAWETTEPELPGKVTQLHWYGRTSGYAALVDNSEWQVLYHTEKSSAYFDIGTATPLLPSPGKPVFATVDAKQGLRFIFLDQASRVGVQSRLSSESLLTLTDRTLWLTRDRQNVFLAPRNSTRRRVLVKMELP
jgi:hypothetical protein